MNQETTQESLDLSGPVRQGPPPPSFWRAIFKLSLPYKKPLAFAACCSILTGVAVAFQPICIKWIVDSGISRKLPDGRFAPDAERMRYAVFFIALYAFLSLSRMGLWLLGYRGFIRSIEDILCQLRGRFFRHVQGLCFRFHDQVSSGELFSYIMGSPMSSLRMFLHQFTMLVPFQIVSLCIAVTALATFNLPMTLITLTMITTIVLVNNRSRRIIKEISADFMKTESNASKYVSDMLSGVRAVKIYAMEDQVNMIFNSHAEMMRNMGVKQTRRQQKERMKPEALNYMGMAVIYLSGAYFVIHDQMELGTFFAFVSSVNLLMGPIMTMMQLNLIRGNAEAGLERIQRILAVRESTVEPADDQAVDLDRQMEIAKAKNLPAVEFKNVCFGYDDKSDVLKNINCRIRHGESIALVGPSGSGKSTFVSLLLRLYDPTEGEILLNDADIRNYNSRELRSRFGVVPQSPFLFQASIADNIRVTNPAATRQQIKHAMDIAHVTEFVDEMPDGVETTLGESGFNLSGGQRQRISIARAALQQSEYFVFDEATSALDNASEDLIMQTMKELTEGHTTLIIAHRLSTVKHVDRVFVFENGRIVQTGTYQELARTEGLFKDLHQRGQVVA